MVPQAWSWRAGDLKHVVDLGILNVIVIGCTGFCSHCFNHCKCKHASPLNPDPRLCKENTLSLIAGQWHGKTRTASKLR